MNSIPRPDFPLSPVAARNATRPNKSPEKGDFTDEEWFSLCEKYGYRCLCCGEVKPLVVDHVVPLHDYGSNLISNIQCLCAQCNRRKSTRTIDYRPAEEGFTPLLPAPHRKKLKPLIIGPHLPRIGPQPGFDTAPYLIMVCRIIAEGNDAAPAAVKDCILQTVARRRRRDYIDSILYGD